MGRPLLGGKLDPGDESRRQWICEERMGETEMSKRIRAALYCRVARDDQFVMDAQVEHLKMFAAGECLDVAAIYCDKAPACQNRPALQNMLRDAEGGSFDVILAFAPSRLARRTEQLWDITRRLERVGVSVRFTDDSERPLMLMAQLWR